MLFHSAVLGSFNGIDASAVLFHHLGALVMLLQ